MTPLQQQLAEPWEPPVPGLESLARERQPAQDLWLGIEARLQPAKAGRRRRTRQPSLWPYGLAASVCVALLTGLLMRGAPEPVAARELATPIAATDQPAAEGRSAYASRPYSHVENETAMVSPRSLRLLRSESRDGAPALVAERAGVSGLTKATYAGGGNAHGQRAILRANLKLVAQAEREVRRALKSDPESASLQSLLSVAQERRATLTNLLVHAQD